MQRLTELVKLPNGNLRIQLTDEGMEERERLRAEYPPDKLEAERERLYKLLRRHLGFGTGYVFDWESMSYWVDWEMCNGWEWIRPEEIAALWGDDNLLADTAVRDDYGELISVGTVYYDNYYAVRDPVTELLSEGYVDFWPAESEAVA